MTSQSKNVIVAWFVILCTVLFSSDSVQASSRKEMVVTFSKPSAVTVQIPQSISCNVTGRTGTAEYEVKVTGDIAPQDCLVIRPENFLFALENETFGKKVEGNVVQNKHYWSKSDVNSGIAGYGNITVDDIPAGEWEGTLEFVLQFTKGNTVDLYSKSLWCWNDNVLTDSSELLRICDELDITRVYQCTEVPEVSDVDKCNALANYIGALSYEGIEVYWTNGDPNWVYDSSGYNSYFNRIIAYNNDYPDAKILGMMLDIEAWCLPEWDTCKEDICDGWLDGYRELLSKTKEAGVTLGSAVSLEFFEEISKRRTVENILNEYCDFYSFMLYDQNQQIYQAKYLAQLAKLHNKQIEIISLGYGNSPEEIKHTWQDIIKSYDCINSNILFSYHHYGDFAQ